MAVESGKLNLLSIEIVGRRLGSRRFPRLPLEGKLSAQLTDEVGNLAL